MVEKTGASKMKKVIVVGGGPAGVTAALRARELGAEVTLVERGRLGGTCTNDGCVPTRVLAHAARLLRDAKQFEAYGLMTNPPALDFMRLMGQVQQVIDQMQDKKQLLFRLEAAGIQVYTGVGDARFEDARTLLLPDGRRLTADRFILCAGGRARRLDFPGEELAMTHSHVWWLKKLPRSVAVLGAAATGCQLASIFNAFGSEVHLLEVMPRILNVEDEAVSGTILSSFERHGMHVQTGLKGVERIDRAGDQLAVRYRGADGLHVLQVETVILSTGWLGNLQPLNLAAAGVEIQGSYVRVDQTLRTTVPHIFAAGDITGRMMLVQSAGSEALLAAENAVLDSDLSIDHRIVPHGGFTDPEYASVGLTEHQAGADGLDTLTATIPFGEMDRAVIDGHTHGVCKLIVNRQNHELLGVHVAGEQALEVVHMVAAGITTHMKVEQLAELEIAYPTIAAVVGLAARKIVQDLGLRPLAPQWRSLGYPPLAEWEKTSVPDSRNDLETQA
jgi:pyruvate/2-oxoglutarate dehydrogenase complex dihydrolipoamide dehydrogenase (E3) component